MLVDAVRVEVMRRRGRSGLVVELGLDAVRRREVGRLVVDRRSHRRRIVADPQSGCRVGHRVNDVRRRHETVDRSGGVVQQIQTTGVQILQLRQSKTIGNLYFTTKW